MARPIWTGAISFGLVNVPVKLYAATSPKEVAFHMLHGADGGRIRQKRVCEVDGQEVPYDQIVKGFEIRKGQYVEVSPEELAEFVPEASRAIELESFVDLSEIDPIYYDRTYYLAPDRGAAKAYALLREVMRTSGKVGVAKVVLRTKQYLCAVRPMGEALALSTMLYPDEVRSTDEVGALPPEEAAPKRELELAGKLLESLEGHFVPERYQNEYREKVLALIERKAEGEEVVRPELPEAAPTQIKDLMKALEASLAANPRRLPAEATQAPPARGERRVRAQAARERRRTRK